MVSSCQLSKLVEAGPGHRLQPFSHRLAERTGLDDDELRRTRASEASRSVSRRCLEVMQGQLLLLIHD